MTWSIMQTTDYSILPHFSITQYRLQWLHGITRVSLYVSVQARDQKTQGNLQLAQECSDKAKWYNILAAGWNLLIPLLAIGILVLLLVHLGTSQASSQGSFDFFGEDGFQNFMKLFSW